MEKNILAWGHPGGASKSHLRFSGQVAEARSVEARTVDACPGGRTRIHAECIACFSFLCTENTKRRGENAEGGGKSVQSADARSP